jgi:oligopeptide/dipeptide ABC transporter ATP-binding protein
MNENKGLLNISGLSVCFFTESEVVRAVEAVELQIDHGEIVGLVGESACGKTVIALSIMRLIPSPGRIVGGEIWFENENLLEKSEPEMQKVRGNRISMIFQEPMSSLNPVLTVGEQIAEAIKWHQGLNNVQAKSKAVEMLELVGIPAPAAKGSEYPHQLSGGMRQRVMIAMALACKPALLIADEPTTALDVTIQAQILRLLESLTRELGTSVLLISHDFGVIAEVCDQVAVMYAGSIVERTSAKLLFRHSCHPYTRGLFSSIPRIDIDVERLKTIRGIVPNSAQPPTGCRFHPRCPITREICRQQEPPMMEIESGHWIRCWSAERLGES